MSEMRHTTTALITLAVIALAGCGSYGGGGGGGGGGGAVSTSAAATLGWTDASGPVAQYRVFVSRNDAPDEPESVDVATSAVTLNGELGDRLRIRVAALAADGTMGPISLPSAEILLTENGPIVSAAATTEEDATGTAEAFPDAPETSVSGEGADASIANEAADTDAGSNFYVGGAGLLLFEADAPSLELRLTSLFDDALQTELSFDRPGEDWSVVGAADFDGDGGSDVLWESGEGVIAFSSQAALMETAPAAPLSLLGELTIDETVISTGDFDGDGRADLLVEDAATGARSIWWVGGIGSTEVSVLDPGDAGAELQASGDFDGDGRGDLVWRGANGALVVHFMDGATTEARLDVAGGDALEPIASGDVDGDGDDDLVVRNAAGADSVLLMHARGAPTPWARSVAAGAGWQLAEVVDLDGDGNDDLLWESDTGLSIGFHAEEDADYVSISPGAGWLLVSFAP